MFTFALRKIGVKLNAQLSSWRQTGGEQYDQLPGGQYALESAPSLSFGEHEPSHVVTPVYMRSCIKLRRVSREAGPPGDKVVRFLRTTCELCACRRRRPITHVATELLTAVICIDHRRYHG